MVGETNRGIQVLNISNVNAHGKTVLNDGKLLDLIQKYPFLYNPRVKAHNDTDYIIWAWKQINAAFNCSYSNDSRAAFSTEELIKRWDVLKPLIQCLSKAYDLEAIPASLRNSVVKISTELEDQSSKSANKTTNNNAPKHFLQQYIWRISKLPKEKKISLEKEVLDLILTTELESKQTTKLNEAALKEINNETDDFLNHIGFKQALINLELSNRPENSLQSYLADRPSIDLNCKSKGSYGWVPLKDAQKFITACKVRVERANVEDYLPLAKILKIDKNKIVNYNSNENSLDIFENL